MERMTPSRRRSSKGEAKARAESIRHHTETLWGLLLAAWEHEDHLALGYESWRDYMAGEYGISEGQSYRLLDQARVTKAIEEAVDEVSDSRARESEPVAVSGRQAAVLKRDLPQAAAEVAAAVEEGAPVAQAVKEAVDVRRAPPPVVTPEVLPARPKRERAKASTPVRRPSVPTGAALPPALVALLRLDPTEAGKGVSKAKAQEVELELRSWASLFVSAAGGRSRAAEPEADCPHPVGRKIGERCGQCGKVVKRGA